MPLFARSAWGRAARGAVVAWLALAGAELRAQQVKLVADTEPLSPTEQLTKFHFPPGFKIELIAAEPDVPKPININFDRQGRLMATCSTEYPFAAPPDRPHKDTIRLITDTNGDGVPDKVTVFADGLNIPIGVVSVPGGVIGYSIPNISFFPDPEGKGKADGRKVEYGTFGFGDTHGMASSFNYALDGWVYACHGFSNTSQVKGADGKTVTMTSGNTYRFKPDGSHLEQWTHGQVNPFGMAFDHRGDIFTADCHTKPITMLLRGGQYPMFGKPHDGLGFAPNMMEHGHESTGIAGVVFYDADQFPTTYLWNLFIGNPVTGRINRDVLDYKGSSPRAVAQPDFLTCDDPWFRPVDIRLAPDGSLYVADFYNRIIGHYEVPLTHPQRDRERGRIWRISYVGQPGEKPKATAAVDVTKETLGGLIGALGHPNIVVRTAATHEIVNRFGKEAVEPLTGWIRSEESPVRRAHGIWALSRLSAAPQSWLFLLNDESHLVRVHALRAVGEFPELNDAMRKQVVEALNDPNAFVQRGAVDVLGRFGHFDNVSPLLSLWNRVPSEDAQLIYSIRMALRDSITKSGLLPVAAAHKPGSPEYLHLIDVAPGVHTAEAAKFLADELEGARLPAGRLDDVVVQIGRYGEPEAQEKLGRALDKIVADTADPERKRSLLRTTKRVRQEKGQPLSADLTAKAEVLSGELLKGADEGTVRRGLELVRELGLKSAAADLATLAAPGSKFPNVQPDAWDALAAIDRAAAFPVLASVVAAPESPAGHRQRAIDSLGNFNTKESRELLVSLLKVLPQGQALSIARALSGSKDGAEALLAAIEKGTTSPRVLQDLTVTKKLEASGVADREKRVGALTAGLPAEDARIAGLISSRTEGLGKASTDAGRGVKVFEKTCAACHKLGTLGQKVGPELDGVGIRGPARLLEDILDPNRNVDAAFRASILALKDGRVVTGLVLREEGKTLVVVDDKGKEQRIITDDVDERKLVKLSPMPANVAETVPEADFYDLMKFLLDQKVKPAAKQ